MAALSYSCLQEEGSLMHWVMAAFIGVLGGLASGLFGVGGGAVIVPMLMFFKKFEIHLAIGTSLAVIIPTALASVIKHAQAGNVDWKVAGLIAVFSIAGAWAGAALCLKLDAAILRRAFAVFLVYVAYKLFFRN